MYMPQVDRAAASMAGLAFLHICGSLVTHATCGAAAINKNGCRHEFEAMMHGMNMYM